MISPIGSVSSRLDRIDYDEHRMREYNAIRAIVIEVGGDVIIQKVRERVVQLETEISCAVDALIQKRKLHNWVK